MSQVYSELKAAETVRQNKYSQALKKSSLEGHALPVAPAEPSIKPVPSRVLFLKFILLPFVILLVLVAFAVAFVLRNHPPPVKKEVKPKVISKHKHSHHKKPFHP